MDEVEITEQDRDARTGLRRLAPEIEAARDRIIEHFEDKPFAELKEFVQKLLDTEEDETKRLGALAARVYLLRKRIIDFEESIEFVPAIEPLRELDVVDDENQSKNWARVRVLENCEVNDMRLPEGIIVDVSAADAQRLIDAGHAELREAADPELSEKEAVSEEDNASESAELPAADEDIQEETGEEIEAETAESADDTVKAETAADVETDADNEADVETDADNEADVETDADNEPDVEMDADNEADVETDAETPAGGESAGDVPELINEASNDTDIELLDTQDHARATAIAETVEAFKELDEALASENAEQSAMLDNKNGESGEDDASDKNDEADET